MTVRNSAGTCPVCGDRLVPVGPPMDFSKVDAWTKPVEFTYRCPNIYDTRHNPSKPEICDSCGHNTVNARGLCVLCGYSENEEDIEYGPWNAST